LRYTNEKDQMFYGSIARGFKSSAFNFSNNPQNDFNYESLLADPKFVTSYEVGFKACWLENKVQVNGAVFYLDYEDLQVKAFYPTCGVLGAGANIFSNAAAVTSPGFELELRSHLTSKLDISAGVGYVDSTFDDFKGLALPRGAGSPGDDNDGNAVDGLSDASGNHVPIAPKWTFNGAAEHAHMFSNGATLQSRWISDLLMSDMRQKAQRIPLTTFYLRTTLHERAWATNHLKENGLLICGLRTLQMKTNPMRRDSPLL
jgi:iron complex outermembrane receptor protein